MSKEILSKNIETLDWDSRFFGYSVGKIEISHLTPEKLRALLANLKDNFKLVYWFVDPKDKTANTAAKENGGLLVDQKTTYLIKIPPKGRRKKDFRVKSYLGKPPNKRLRLLALEAGIYSRYRVDPNCVSGEFEKLYAEWVRKSLNGEIAKDVLVYVEKGKEVGFITLGEKAGHCNIGLIAVSTEMRGKGIGKKLVNAGFEKGRKWGYKAINVVTQKANKGACNFYEKLGFKIDSVVNVYHFWF